MLVNYREYDVSINFSKIVVFRCTWFFVFCSCNICNNFNLLLVVLGGPRKKCEMYVHVHDYTLHH